MLNRVSLFAPNLDETTYTDSNREIVPAPKANLVSSLLDDGRHAPAIDIDHPCRLVRSSTRGHHHLYIDVPMPWWKYRLLLRVLVLCGIVEKNYYSVSVSRGSTQLRKPGVVKHA